MYTNTLSSCPFQRGLAILRAIEAPQSIEIRHALSNDFFVKVHVKIQQLNSTWQHIIYAAQSCPILVDEPTVIFLPDVCQMLSCYLRQLTPLKLYFTVLPAPRNRLQEVVTALLLEVDEETSHLLNVYAPAR